MSDTRKVFRVDYLTEHGRGVMRVYVGSFFGTLPLKNTNEFIRFARVHCTSEQKEQLLRDLEEEKLRFRGTERERIEKCIQKIAKQKWSKIS